MFQLETLWYPPLWGPLIIAVHQPSSALQAEQGDYDFFSFFFNRWQNSQRDGFAFCSFLYLSLPSFYFVLSSLFFSLSFWEKKREAWYTCQAGFAASLLSSLWFEGFDYETVSHYQELASFSNHASQHYVWKWHSNGDIKKPSNKNGVAYLLL